MKLPPAPTSRGFTLIELLTVIAIVGILAAIIIPTVGKVRESARGVRCLSNLRQIGTAQFLYASDHKDIFTPIYSKDNPITWLELMKPYLGGRGNDDAGNIDAIINCPSRTPIEDPASAVPSYGMNSSMWEDRWKYKVGVIPAPSQIILAGDRVDDSGWADYIAWNGSAAYSNPAFRHNGSTRSNMVMCDGSARAFARDELEFRMANGQSFFRWW